MSVKSATDALLPDEERWRLQQIGQRIYDDVLKAKLEPQENGRMVAVHLDSSEYVVEDTYPQALRKLRISHPEGLIVALRVGNSIESPAVYRAYAHQQKGTRAK